MDRFHSSSARSRGPVPYLRLVHSAPSPATEQDCPWRFTSADLIALDEWSKEADSHEYRRVLIETGAAATVPADGGYALLYAPGRLWATWGLAREDDAVVAWHCGSGADLGRFASMRLALDSLPGAFGNSAPRSNVERNIQGSRKASGASVLKAVLSAFVLIGAVAISAPAPTYAKGCLKGAAVGGVAGHVAGHHGVLGAAAGCAVGHHEANKHQKQQQQNVSQSPKP